ncbi:MULTISPECIES: hypothetical protein [unclassified Pusillimonas]|nr:MULTISPECIES: hypothetical protein [unclassified Pusillimonas]
MSVFSRAVRKHGVYRGSAILLSGLDRLWRVALVVLALWALTGWAMQWW